LFWYKGKLIQGNVLELEIDDPGLLYGATVFTTLRVYQQSLDSRLTNWQAHCDRLHSSIQNFGWQQPDWEGLRNGAEKLLPSFPVLRITIFPDGREWITGRFLPADLKQRQQNGIIAWLADAPQFERSLPTHKTGNYLTAWMALNQAKLTGMQEAILVDAAGNWLETSTGNLWGWRDGRWWTPPLAAGILPGVMRSQIIDWQQRYYQPVGEVIWDKDWVQEVEAIAYSNSVVEVVPIHTVISQNCTLAFDPLHRNNYQLTIIND
jgi:4-amino-4-deoxychorismate lyase